MSETVRLYHFVNAKFGIENIKYRRLKVAFANQVNDIFEMRPFNFGDNEIGQKICDAWGTAIDKHAMEQGFISFSEGWSVPTMWAHYADNHKGICLGFDLPIFWKGETKLLDKVEYVENLRHLDERVLNDDKYNGQMVEFARKTKSCRWKYEQEWRVWNSLTPSEKEEKCVTPSTNFFVNFDKNLALKEVIFGNKSESSTRSKAQGLINPSDGVKFTMALRSPRAFKMVPE